MNYRDLLGQRSIARIKNKLNEKQNRDKTNKLEIFTL